VILPGLILRNPSVVTQGARSLYETRKVMAAHRERHPACALTGRTDGVHVHHIYPCAIAPERAADPTNLITLHARLHFWFAHAGNWKHYVLNVRELLEAALVQRTMSLPAR